MARRTAASERRVAKEQPVICKLQQVSSCNRQCGRSSPEIAVLTGQRERQGAPPHLGFVTRGTARQ
jgi:hypothetical protein